MNLGGWLDRARQKAEDLVKKIPLPKKGGDKPAEEPGVDLEATAAEPEVPVEIQDETRQEAQDEPAGLPPAPADVQEKAPTRPYVAISRVGSVRGKSPRKPLPVIPSPVSVPEAPAPSGTPHLGVAQVRGAAVKAPAPTAVRNMHRFELTPMTGTAAEFTVSQLPGADTGEELDLGDDLFSLVARTINLKLRRSPEQAPEEEG